MYRTGDFGSYLDDGQIAFAGRADDQLKIRGHRVETNEIIAVLGRHPAVQASMVVSREDETGSKYLVAYVRYGPGIRAHPQGAAGAPAHIPAGIYGSGNIRAARKAATQSHGKVDRQALPVLMPKTPCAMKSLPRRERLWKHKSERLSRATGHRGSRSE